MLVQNSNWELRYLYQEQLSEQSSFLLIIIIIPAIILLVFITIITIYQ